MPRGGTRAGGGGEREREGIGAAGRGLEGFSARV